MSCCGGNIAAECAVGAQEVNGLFRDEELLRTGKLLPDGRRQYVFSIPAVKCGKCISTVEKTLAAMEDVGEPRVNLTLRRVSFTLPDGEISPAFVMQELERIGYPAGKHSPEPTCHLGFGRSTKLIQFAMGVEQSLLHDVRGIDLRPLLGPKASSSQQHQVMAKVFRSWVTVVERFDHFCSASIQRTIDQLNVIVDDPTCTIHARPRRRANGRW